MAFQLTRRGVERPGSGEVRAWRAAFAEHACIRLPEFLEPALLRRVQQRIAVAAWEEHVHDADPPSTDLLLIDPVLDGVLTALIHDPELFDIVRAVTGCDAIGSFAGRIYRLDAGGDHHHAWHGDDDPGAGLSNRMATLSVNMSTGTYAGGVLELRRRGSDRLLHRVANTAPATQSSSASITRSSTGSPTSRGPCRKSRGRDGSSVSRASISAVWCAPRARGNITGHFL